MKHRILIAALASCLLANPLTTFAAPPLINYQGRIVVGTTNFNSPPNGLFKFALVNADGTASYWSNTATTPFPTEPTAAVSLPVTKGLYSVLLGDTTIPNMIAIPTSAFGAPDLRLRVWFSDGTNGFQQLTPDQRLAPTAYLADGIVNSANIVDGSIISSKVAPGAITGAQIATNTLVASSFATTGSPSTGQVLSFNGTGLNWVTPGGISWALVGNAGTTAANFLGTTDNQNLIFKTTNLERLRLTTGGELVLQKPDAFPAFSVRNGLGVYGVGNAFDDVGRFFAGANILGPVLYGQSGGGLGVKSATNVETLALRWDSTGNVGIGISTPASKLEVRTATGNYGLLHSDGTIKVGSYLGSSASGANGGWLGTQSNHPLHLFVNNGQPSMTIQTDGGVNIASASGIALDAADAGPMITRGNDPFNSNAPLDLDGHGRWGLFKDLSTLICGIPDIAGNTFQVCKYTPDGGRNTLLVVNQAGNVGIGMGPSPGPQQKLHVIGNILASGTITGSSDRNVKRNFTPVNSTEVLDKVAALPISTWSYIADDGVRHLGPMAQDFYSAFNVGMDDKHISMVDADGVALAAIQGLNRKVEEKDAEMRSLQARLKKLEQLLDRKSGRTERKQP